MTLSDVSFAYPDGQHVFNQLNFAIRQGEFVAVLGPSGCGKSTLLNLLSGFLLPTGGNIHIQGEKVYPGHPSLGYIFQSPQLFPWLNVLENIRFGLKMAGTLSQQQQIDKARYYMQVVGLADMATRLPHQLSGGMQQRIALARVLATEPTLLLADEPFSALDAITRRHMNEELLRLRAQFGQTVLFITHDIDEAVFLADRVIVLGRAPAGIECELNVELPYPRRFPDTPRHPLFLHYREQLLERIAYATEHAR